ncbi:Enterochelin esterase [Rosistilla oblonga]|uniref:enterochelin esterase domain-containing protein n=1 Tax=Rosistilla oblonga TaxID=2527990 RepID=UPI00118A5C45|nr:enterochelin esterase domain-containing protein [Rosistilla oblonga]QDV13832.1 Enterochelin esterase [Rosistilla oblonga]
MLIALVVVACNSSAKLRASENASPPAAATLTLGEPLNDSLDAQGNSPTIVIPASAGDFIRGAIDGEQLVLSLVGSAGNHIRQLTAGHGKTQTFMFVVGSEGPYAFSISGPAKGEFSLTLRSSIPLAKQKAPQPELQSPRLRQLQQELLKDLSTERFWSEIGAAGAPLVESEGVMPPLPESDALVTFLWRGDHHNVRLFGAPSGDHDELHRLGDSDVWYRSYRVPRDARIDYRFAPDVPVFDGTPWERRRAILATAQRDPLNKLCFPADPVDNYDGSSVVELPDAPQPIWIESNPETPRGVVTRHQLTSETLGNTRDIHLYRPDGYRPGDPENGLLLVFDGDKYLQQIDAATILDNLIAAKAIRSTTAIFVSNPSPESRSLELPCNPDFANFIAGELIPWARTQEITASPANSVIAGASYGGLAAAYIGHAHPELFGNVYCQSGSFWWSSGSRPTLPASEPEWLARQIADAPRQPIRFHLEAGKFEVDILNSTRHLRDVLTAKGYAFTYRQYASSHGYFYWRYTFANGLIDLLQP